MFLPGMRRISLSRILRRSGLVASCLALLLAAGCGKEQKAAPPPPPAVEVSEVIRKDVPVYTEWVGTTDGLVNATIQAQVTGYLVKQNYREGELVKKGQVLFEIDPRTFQAAVDAAKGSLAQAEARWETAKANLQRVRPLAAKNAVSQKDLDDNIGAELSTRAAVESAKAQLDTAQLNLGFTRIASPVDGIAGIAKAQIGNLVGPGQIQELTAVSTVDPIKAYIAISEQEYMKFRRGTGGAGGGKGSGGHPARIDPRRRHRLPPQGEVLPGGPAGGREDRHDAGRGALPQPRQPAAPRPVRNRPGDHGDEEGGAAGPAARGDGGAGEVPRRGGG